MSESDKRQFGTMGQSNRSERTLDLPAARKMLPLVKAIVRDIVDCHQKITKLVPVEERLERQRKSLDWREREQRYKLQDELTQAQGELKKAVTELKALGLALVDEDKGCVAFPTRINGRAAIFTWQPGEDSVQFWSYEGEEMRRPIPTEVSAK